MYGSPPRSTEAHSNPATRAALAGSRPPAAIVMRQQAGRDAALQLGVALFEPKRLRRALGEPVGRPLGQPLPEPGLFR